MLLYAAVRLLPPAWTADLTFSTFEPYHRGIQDYKLATVVGTYFGVPGQGLDEDVVSGAGRPRHLLPERSSRNCPPHFRPGVRVDRPCVAGEWTLLADVHKLIGVEDAMARVTSAVAARAASAD